MVAAESTLKRRQAVDGVLLLDKPTGVTSNRALQRVKGMLRLAKAGHTGTLDPLATGLLPICCGEATKFSRFQLEADKHYLASARFGQVSDTGDSDGVVKDRQSDVTLDVNELESALDGFRGKIIQRPPVYSALKVNGRRLCDHARDGVILEPQSRVVEVSSFRLVEIDGVVASFDIVCSKGTYVRSLITDLGDLLGCGAHVVGLRRLGSGGLSVDRAVTFEALEQAVEQQRPLLELLLPVSELVKGLPQLELSTAQAAALRHGQSVATQGHAVAAGSTVALRSAGQFFGVGEYQDERLVPKRLCRQ